MKVRRPSAGLRRGQMLRRDRAAMAFRSPAHQPIVSAMTLHPPFGLGHVFGDEAVLSRLERLGRQSRIFPHLVRAGFPPRQLNDARQWFAEAAGTPVDFYASRNMARGFFEDESLLKLFCRYFACADWKLENSPWFFSHEDYEQFFGALLDPIEFSTRQLEQGLGEERWGRLFEKLPFDLAMDCAKQDFWEGICRQDFYWKPGITYAHLRAEALFGYLRRSVDILMINPGLYNYEWERVFRDRLERAMTRFANGLAAAVEIWAELRRVRARQARGRRGAFTQAALIGSREVLESFALLGLEPSTATLKQVRAAFRRLSKETHPDQGGSPEAFRRLNRGKEVAEAWLARPRRG